MSEKKQSSACSDILNFLNTSINRQRAQIQLSSQLVDQFSVKHSKKIGKEAAKLKVDKKEKKNLVKLLKSESATFNKTKDSMKKGTKHLDSLLKAKSLVEKACVARN
eukprot:gnl/Spiro4/28708_TR14203_c0_g1_i1.p1 gnl/Spiro4/28708_TR14203_c0_g1~~gnl/Spiro4/28708_TR14203_c0_g1_i1.p1  ORF type:complete len:107 (-),score=43.76 gnl/Spiro4/28708_TR14203_c0_g1_i1:121-441(-)